MFWRVTGAWTAVVGAKPCRRQATNPNGTAADTESQSHETQLHEETALGGLAADYERSLGATPILLLGSIEFVHLRGFIGTPIVRIVVSSTLPSHAHMLFGECFIVPGVRTEDLKRSLGCRGSCVGREIQSMEDCRPLWYFPQNLFPSVSSAVVWCS